MPLLMVLQFIMIHGGNSMIEMWMPVVANIILIMLGMVFVVGGGNTFSRLVGMIAVLVAVLSLLFNTGVLK